MGAAEGSIGLGLAGLLDQLTLLDKKLEEVADAVNKNDADALLAKGRFLEDRFGGSALTLPAPSARPSG